MKKKDIFLDFTSLLDVTLIIIFFFVIFSHLDSEENKAFVEEKVNELETSIYEAEQRESDARDLLQAVEEELEMVRNVDKRQSLNLEAMIEYVQGANIKIILDIEDDVWNIRIIHNGKLLDKITKEKPVGEQLIQVFQKAGYKKEDTIFCDFTFDASVPGTAKAYNMIKKGLDEVKEEYGYMYFSETDLSIGEH